MARHPKPIQINIPNPCHQDWDKMTPAGQGRFCSHCQKAVVDFTNFTDAELYEFFTKNVGQTCGRLLAIQLNREIHIPYQPNSSLYKWAIAAGLVLVLAQVPAANAQTKPPYAHLIQVAKEHRSAQSLVNNGVITGKVLDEKGRPLTGAIVTVFYNGIAKAVVPTDQNGRYFISSLAEEQNYLVRVSCIGYEEKSIPNVLARNNSMTVHDISLDIRHMLGLLEMVIVDHRIPLGQNSIDKNDLKHMGQ